MLQACQLSFYSLLDTFGDYYIGTAVVFTVILFYSISKRKWGIPQKVETIEMKLQSIPGISTTVKKKILVTGGTDGIGREATILLTSLGHDVTIAGRSQEKADDLNEECFQKYEKNVQFHCVDLSSIQQTEEFAEIVAVENYDICIMNAGLMNPEKSDTVDGFDMTMMTNLVSTYIIVKRMLNQKSENQKIHFVFITSLLMKFFTFSVLNRLMFDPTRIENWKKAIKPEKKSGTVKYAISKIGHAVMAVFINRMKLPGVTATAIHPGCVVTNLMMSLPARQRFYLMLCKPFITTKEEAGVHMVRAAFNTLAENKYYETSKEVDLPTVITRNDTVSAFTEFGDSFLRN